MVIDSLHTTDIHLSKKIDHALGWNPSSNNNHHIELNQGEYIPIPEAI